MKNKAIVKVSPKAMAKMVGLVMAAPEEIGWHGSVTREGERTFRIDDIYCFPQYVSGGSTTTDYCEYQMWKYTGVPLDIKMAMHGHSHVNMPVFRSGRDARYQHSMMTDVSEDGFYIFIILNKRLDTNIMIYDKLTNNVWTTQERNVRIEIEKGPRPDVSEFVAEAMSLVHPLSELPPQPDDYVDGDEFNFEKEWEVTWTSP